MIIEEDLAENKEDRKIPVINTVDSDQVPYAFHYVAFNVEEGLSRTQKGCDCTDGCKPRSCQCIMRSSITILEDNKIDLSKGHPDYYKNVLFECNEQTCKGCRGKCGWRLTPELFDLEVEMFKTPKAGWAVRSRQFIEAGRFFGEFVGEVVDEVLQEHRPLEYAYQLTPENSSRNVYIDPYKYGNITRFLNHSCFENLQPFRFYSSHRDVTRGSIGFYARRDILPGDELTIDYGESWWTSNIQDAKKEGRKLYCQCNWVYCINPAPGKPQMKEEDAKKKMRQVMIEKHRKLMAWKRGQKRIKMDEQLGAKMFAQS